MFTANWIRPDILEIEYDSLSTLMNATYRFSHYHEYPEWREKKFTKEDLFNHYKEKYGDPLWWINQWAGANLRDSDLKPFIDGEMGELDELEQQVIDLVKDKEGPYALALYAKQTKVVRDHEIAHALFYLDNDYAEKVIDVVETYKNEYQPLVEALSELYDEENMTDELHVYGGIFYHHWAFLKGIQVPRDARRELCKIFKKHLRKCNTV